MSAAERRALLLLLARASSARACAGGSAARTRPPARSSCWPRCRRARPPAHRDSILALARPLGPDERIDADRATGARAGPAPPGGSRAGQDDRGGSRGPGAVRGASGLDRVPGVGAGLLAAIGPHLAFSGPSSPARTAADNPNPGRRSGRASGRGAGGPEYRGRVVAGRPAGSRPGPGPGHRGVPAGQRPVPCCARIVSGARNRSGRPGSTAGPRAGGSR